MATGPIKAKYENDADGGSVQRKLSHDRDRTQPARTTRPTPRIRHGRVDLGSADNEALGQLLKNAGNDGDPAQTDNASRRASVCNATAVPNSTMQCFRSLSELI